MFLMLVRSAISLLPPYADHSDVDKTLVNHLSHIYVVFLIASFMVVSGYSPIDAPPQLLTLSISSHRQPSSPLVIFLPCLSYTPLYAVLQSKLWSCPFCGHAISSPLLSWVVSSLPSAPCELPTSPTSYFSI